MIVVRKIDLTLQGFILGIALLALLMDADYLYFIEPVLGIWQLISALFNSYSMNQAGNGYRSRMIIYWIISITALLTLWISSAKDVVFFVVTHCCWAIAVYYWIIYFLFIRHLEERQRRLA